MSEFGLRDRKKRRTRQAIRAAAIELFTQQGVEGTTVDQIATLAEISPRTFFNYFESKEQAVSLPYGLRYEAGIPPAADDPWTAIVNSCLLLARTLDADEAERPTLLAGVRLCQHESSLRDQASLQRGRWEALMTSAMEPTLANRVRVNAAAGAVWAALSDWASADGAGTLVGRVEESLNLIGQCLGPSDRSNLR